MFSLCEKCGYTADPQDIVCVVCTDLTAPRSEWVRMVKRVK